MLVKTYIALLSFGLLFGQFTSSAFAQNQTTGSIAGSVKDQNGALLAGADVKVSNKATGEKRNVVTDNEGSYVALLLAPGTYSVRIVYNGFADAVFEVVQVVVT